MANTQCIVREDEKWQATAQKWLEVNQQLTALKEEEKKLREELIELADDQSTTGCGVKLTKSIRKGSVQYAQIPELQTVDLDQYRKEPTESWRLVAVKEDVG